MGIVTAKMLGSRFTKTRTMVPRSALRATRMASRRGIWSIRRTKVKTRRPRALGASISLTM